MAWIKLSEAVDRYKKTRQYIVRMGEKGSLRIKREMNGRIMVDVPSADNHFKYIPPYVKKRKFKKKVVDEPGKSTTVDDLFKQLVESGQTLQDLEEKNLPATAQVELALKREKLETQRIKNEQQAGVLIERTKVNEFLFMIGRNVRDSIESVPARVSALCVGKTQHEIEGILAEEIKRVLSILVEKYE